MASAFDEGIIFYWRPCYQPSFYNNKTHLPGDVPDHVMISPKTWPSGCYQKYPQLVHHSRLMNLQLVHTDLFKYMFVYLCKRCRVTGTSKKFTVGYKNLTAQLKPGVDSQIQWCCCLISTTQHIHYVYSCQLLLIFLPYVAFRLNQP